MKVTLFLSRDLDSRFSAREVAAVSQWMDINQQTISEAKIKSGNRKSNYAFHFLRDHPSHDTAILGSAWGMNRSASTKAKRKIILAWMAAFRAAEKKPGVMYAGREQWGQDQILLAR